MTDMRVMLDLDSEQLRELLAKRLYEDDPAIEVGTNAALAWDDVTHARRASYREADLALRALRGLAADGLLVRG